MTVNEQRLNKKLAEWAGFTSVEVYNDGFVGYTPTAQYDSHIPLFTQSLDACFKWLVPKAWKIGHEYKFHNLMIDWLRDALDEYKSREALVLCLAIEKLIDM